MHYATRAIIATLAQMFYRTSHFLSLRNTAETQEFRLTNEKDHQEWRGKALNFRESKNYVRR